MGVAAGQYLGQFAFCVSYDIYADFALDIVSGNGMAQIRLPIVRTPPRAKDEIAKG